MEEFKMSKQLESLECPMCFELLLEPPSTESDVGGPLPSKRKRMLPTGGSVLEITPCGHVFHKKCIRDWIDRRGNKSCPTCRKQVTHGRLKPAYLPVSDSTTSQYAKAKAVAEDLKKKLDAETKEKTDLVQAKTKSDKEVADKERELTALKIKMKEMENEVQMLTEAKLGSDKKLTKTEASRQELQNRLQTLETQNQRLWVEKNAMEEEKTERILELQEQILKERDYVEETNQKCQDLEERNGLLIEDLNDLAIKRIQGEEEIQILKGIKASLENEVAAFRIHQAVEAVAHGDDEEHHN